MAANSDTGAPPLGREEPDDTNPVRLFLRTTTPRLSRWALICAEFAASQAAIQFVGAVAGFVVLRFLAKPEYALLAIANSVISLFSIFTEIGIGAAMRSIGGKRVGERDKYSQLIAAVTGIRYRVAAIALCFLLPYAAWMFASNGASVAYTCVLLLLFAGSCLPLLVSQVLRSSSMIMGHYRSAQLIDFASASARLSITLPLLFALPIAAVVLVAAVVANVVQVLFYRKQSEVHIDFQAGASREDVRRIWELMLTLAPNSLFFAFQGQLSLILLTVFASTTEVADIVAVTRIAILLDIVASVFYNVLAPRYARITASEHLVRNYILIVCAAIVCAVFFVALIYFVPGPFVWLLGPQYANVEWECVVAAAVSGVSMLAGTMVALNQSHAWVRWYAVLYIPVAIAGLTIGAVTLDLSTVEGVLLLGFAVPAAAVMTCTVDAAVGLCRSAKIAK